MQNQAIFFFGYLGVFNGLILSIYFFFFKAKRTLSAYLLGALLFVLSIRIGKSVAYWFDYSLARTYLQLGLTACSFIGPLLYFFVTAETKQILQLPKSWRWQLTGWGLIIATVGVIFPYEYAPHAWGHYIIPLIYLQWGAYCIAAIFTIFPNLKKLFRKNQLRSFEKWTMVICGAVTILWLSYVWSYFNLTKGSYISGALLFSLIMYAVVFALLYRKGTNLPFLSVAGKYGDRKIDPEETDLILRRIQKVMSGKELFKNPNLKIHDLAKEINASGHQLSQILNETMRKNFSQFVNEYRIAEACRLLSEPNPLTIASIGQEVGFQSTSTFFAAFKKIKGTTPGSYQQSATTDL